MEQVKAELLADGTLTIDKACEFASIGRTELYQWMGSGRLPFVQAGRRRLIPRRALVLLLAGQLVGVVARPET